MKRTDPKRTLKEKYLKIQTKSPILRVLPEVAEMTIKQMMQVIEMYTYSINSPFINKVNESS